MPAKIFARGQTPSLDIGSTDDGQIVNRPHSYRSHILMIFAGEPHHELSPILPEAQIILRALQPHANAREALGQLSQARNDKYNADAVGDAQAHRAFRLSEFGAKIRGERVNLLVEPLQRARQFLPSSGKSGAGFAEHDKLGFDGVLQSPDLAPRGHPADA